MAARMGPLVLPRTPYAVSSAQNNFKTDRYLNFSTSQISEQYWYVVIADMGTPRTVLPIWVPLLADMAYFGTPSCGYERPS